MNCYSTLNPALRVPISKAILDGLADDGSLYMPENIPRLPDEFLKNLSDIPFETIAFEITTAFLQNQIPREVLLSLINDAINFPAPVFELEENLGVLELFHGPTLAFKDFGARFMSRIMSYLNKEKPDLTILVATSGDTGGAVASGFFNVPGIRVIILYPKGGVSFLQEKQLTTLGRNITALEIDGTFDDCQTLVKKAFVDIECKDRLNLSSANSINLARLIPQTFYYFEGVKQIKTNKNIVCIVPSGNFGNLTAGVMAKRMGLNISRFIAATNINDVVPAYLTNSIYKPKPSISTVSNAMDVGNPSNFDRLMDLYGSTWNRIIKEITGYHFSDEKTLQTIEKCFKEHGYLLDPHTAVGYLAYLADQSRYGNIHYLLLATAHPSKFLETVEKQIGQKVNIPARLVNLKDLPKKSILLSNNYYSFKEYLFKTFF